MRELRICHLWPDVLNLYGDRGNVLCLQKRLLWRGVPCRVTELPLGEWAALSDFDLFFIGGGQDKEQELLLGELRRGRGDELRAAVADGKTFLCVCGGYQLMGATYEAADGVRCDFLGVLDACTVSGPGRLVGPLAFDTDWGPVTGFENHGGRTWLGPGAKPLGRVLKGNGNNGQDGTEGARHLNLFATYAHGPLLPANPALCDGILETALARRGESGTLPPLSDLAENAAHDDALRRLGLSRR